MHHSDAQRARRRAGPSPAPAEQAFGSGASSGRLESYHPTPADADASEFEASWHLWFLIVAGMTVGAMVLATLTFQAG